MKKDQKLTADYTVHIEVPYLLKTGIPGHLQLDFLMKSLPHVIKNIFQGEADVDIKEIVGKN